MLKKKAFFATLWSAADIFLRQGLQLFVTIALARLLSPDEFGTIALLSLFIAISTVLIDSGFSSALIQKQNVTHTEESTVFWFNLIAGIFVAAALSLVAPHIAAFFGKPVLTYITYALSFVLVINATGAIHVALLTKRLDFLTQMKIGTTANLVSGALAIFLAWRGFGIWSLVAHAITSSALSNLLLWIFNPWRPLFTFNFSSARILFGFGGYMVAATLLNTLYTKGYSLLIGKLYSARDLGIYGQAENTQQFPASVLSAILSRVAFPIFSALAGDKAKLKRGLQLCVRGMMLINTPVMLGLATVASTMVEAVFGAQWLPAAPLLQILCLTGLLWPLHVININVLLAQGHSKLIFNIQIIKSLLGVAMLAFGSVYGVIGIAWSQVVLSATGFLINTHYTKIYLDYGALRQLRDNLPVLLATLPMIFVIHLLGIYWEATPIIKLLGLTLIGALLFAATCCVARFSAVKDMLSLFNKVPAVSVNPKLQIKEL